MPQYLSPVDRHSGSGGWCCIAASAAVHEACGVPVPNAPEVLASTDDGTNGPRTLRLNELRWRHESPSATFGANH